MFLFSQFFLKLYVNFIEIKKAMQEWGALLIQYYNKNLDVKENDVTANYLSYWMDNGAYYYWLTEPGKTYQDTVFDVIKHVSDNNIPFRYNYSSAKFFVKALSLKLKLHRTVQYDSWWYGAQRG